MDFVSMMVGIILFTVGVPLVNFISTLLGTLCDYIVMHLSVKIAWYNHMVLKIKRMDGIECEDPMAIGFEVESDDIDFED